MTRLVLTIAAVVLLVGCGDDDNPTTPLPQAGNTFPADGATGIPPVTALMWTAEEAPVKALQHYRVLMGGGPEALAHVGNTVETYLVRRDLELDATYYWAVEAVGDDGATTRGGPWSFTTVSELAAPVVSRFLNGGPWAATDTVGYGQPVVLSWSAVSAYAATTPPAALALLDTVAPSTDGVLGYQYAFSAFVPPLPEDWQPPYFGAVQSLDLGELPSSIYSHWLSVNALDFAGATVPLASQALSLALVINFDPDTRIERTRTYPYYVVFHGPEAGEYNFAEGDTVPDRAYVVLRATGWDDPRDLPLIPPGEIQYQGNFLATGLYYGQLPYSFAATYSTPTTADTLGFLVGPFAYQVTMRAIDEHGRRDGTPDALSFHANFPPCVQCIELVNAEPATQPTIAYEDACADQACLAPSTLLRAPLGVPVSPTDLSLLSLGPIWVDVDGDVLFTEPNDPDSYQAIPAKHFAYVIYLHGKNPPREHWPHGHADQRIAAWRYQVDYEADPDNILRDGGGFDFLGSLSGFDLTTNNPDPRASDLFIVQDEGLPYRGAWGIRVTVGVPQILQTAGPEVYWQFLCSLYAAPAAPPAGSAPEVVCAWQQDPAVQRAHRAWELTTMQFSPGTVQAIASDASRCDWRHETNMYHYFEGVRVPPRHGWQCRPGYYDDEEHVAVGAIDLENFPTDSEPAIKRFQIEVETPAGPFVGGDDPPGWIPCATRWHLAARR